MNNRERVEATTRLDDAIQFRQAARGYWYPYLLVDRHAIALTGVQFRPRRTPDEILTDFSDKAFCQFNVPPLGRNSEAANLIAAYRERQVSLDLIASKRPLSAGELNRVATIAMQLVALEYPTAEVLDAAKDILKTI